MTAVAHWRDLLAEYLEAKRRHNETQRIMDRAQRLAWKHLAKRVGDERAYQLAGVSLADERNVRAYAAEQEARERLIASLQGVYIDRFAKLMAFGALLCSERPDAANDA